MMSVIASLKVPWTLAPPVRSPTITNWKFRESLLKVSEVQGFAPVNMAVS